MVCLLHDSPPISAIFEKKSLLVQSIIFQDHCLTLTVLSVKLPEIIHPIGIQLHWRVNVSAKKNAGFPG